MKKQREARIIVTYGTRYDLKAKIDVYDLNTEKLQQTDLTAGPAERDIETVVRQLKNDLERGGCRVHVIERHAQKGD